MAKLGEGNYGQQTQEYRDKYSRDEFKGQKQQKAKRMAGDALLEEGETRKDLTRAERTQIRADAGITHAGEEGNQFYSMNDKGKRKLTDIGEDNNPFKVDKLRDFDLAAFGQGSAKGKEILNVQDAKRLMNEGGFSAERIQEKFGDQAAKGAQNFLARKLGQTTGGGSGGGGNDDGSGGGGGSTEGGGNETGGGNNGGGNDGGAGNNNSGGGGNKYDTSGVGLKAMQRNVDDIFKDQMKDHYSGMKNTLDFHYEYGGGKKDDETYKNVKQDTYDTVDYFRNRSNKLKLGIFGDMWNQQSPKFELGDPPEEITTSFGNNDDDDD